jgi:hypothetical protein
VLKCKCIHFAGVFFNEIKKSFNFVFKAELSGYISITGATKQSKRIGCKKKYLIKLIKEKKHERNFEETDGH